MNFKPYFLSLIITKRIIGINLNTILLKVFKLKIIFYLILLTFVFGPSPYTFEDSVR